MNTAPIQNDFAAKATAAAPVATWQAWKLGTSESRPLDLDAPETLDEAVAQAMLCGINPGDKLAVMYAHAGRRRNTLWLFTVKRSTKVHDYRPALDGGKPVRVGRLYPELFVQTSVEAFAPVRPFDAFRDNAAGRDLTLVEGANND